MQDHAAVLAVSRNGAGDPRWIHIPAVALSSLWLRKRAGGDCRPLSATALTARMPCNLIAGRPFGHEHAHGRRCADDPQQIRVVVLEDATDPELFAGLWEIADRAPRGESGAADRRRARMEPAQQLARNELLAKLTADRIRGAV